MWKKLRGRKNQKMTKRNYFFGRRNLDERERKRERERERDKQTDRERKRWTETKRGKEREGQKLNLLLKQISLLPKRILVMESPRNDPQTEGRFVERKGSPISLYSEFCFTLKSEFI